MLQGTSFDPSGNSRRFDNGPSTHLIEDAPKLRSSHLCKDSSLSASQSPSYVRTHSMGTIQTQTRVSIDTPSASATCQDAGSAGTLTSPSAAHTTAVKSVTDSQVGVSHTYLLHSYFPQPHTRSLHTSSCILILPSPPPPLCVPSGWRWYRSPSYRREPRYRSCAPPKRQAAAAARDFVDVAGRGGLQSYESRRHRF